MCFYVSIECLIMIKLLLIELNNMSILTLFHAMLYQGIIKINDHVSQIYHLGLSTKLVPNHETSFAYGQFTYAESW